MLSGCRFQSFAFDGSDLTGRVADSKLEDWKASLIKVHTGPMTLLDVRMCKQFLTESMTGCSRQAAVQRGSVKVKEFTKRLQAQEDRRLSG